jgi:hypothetical protein
MKVGDVFTLPHEQLGSAGYTTGLVKLEKLALIGLTHDPAPSSGYYGSPSTLHFTFQAIEAGVGKVQFATYRHWLLPEISSEPELTFSIDERVEGKEAGKAGAINPGGWTPFNEANAEAQELFSNAIAEHAGSGFTPLLFTSKVVAGTNYIFVANGRIVYPGATDFPALVSISKDLDGKAHVTGIKALGYAKGVGNYGPFHPVSEYESAVFNQVTADKIGVSFEANYVSTQVVSGINYRFAGTETITDKDSTKRPVFITVYAPLDGTPYITGVQNVYDLV